MHGAVEPPIAMVVPEMVVRPRSLLTAGDNGLSGIHEDVVFWIHDAAVPGKKNARPVDISTGVGKFR